MEAKQVRPTDFRKLWNVFGSDVTKECEQSLKLTRDTKSCKQLSLRRIIFTKKELAFFDIVPEAECMYSEEDDSIEHCLFQGLFPVCPNGLRGRQISVLK